MECAPPWIVVPAFEEAHVVGDVVRDLLAHYGNVVVVDDGSRDDTAKIASTAGAHLVRHPINLGQGAAIQTGIDYALDRGAQSLVTFDADGQHQVADIAVLIEMQRQSGCDVILGNRFLGSARNIPRSRRLALRLAVAYTRVIDGVNVGDTHNGLRLITRRAAQRIRITQNRMAHASEILSQIRVHGLSFREAPVNIHYTGYSLDKGQKLTDSINILAEILVGRLKK